MVVPREAAKADAEANLNQLLAETRTGVTADVFVLGERDFFELLRESSVGADLVFMGIREPTEADFADYYRDLRDRTRGMPTTVYVLAAEEIQFSEVLT